MPSERTEGESKHGPVVTWIKDISQKNKSKMHSAGGKKIQRNHTENWSKEQSELPTKQATTDGSTIGQALTTNEKCHHELLGKDQNVSVSNETFQGSATAKTTEQGGYGKRQPIMVAKQDGFAPATSKTTEKPAKSLLDTLKCPARYAKEIRAQIGHMSDKSGNRSARELVTDLSDAVILSLSQYDGKDESFSPTDLSRNILLRLRRQLHKFDDSDGVISCIDAALKETTPSQ